MKIVVLGTRGFPKVQGGIETHCENLYPALVQRGCDVTVLTRKPYIDPKLRSYKGVRFVSIHCFKNKFLETILHTFVGVLKARKLNPDILHIHAIGPSILTPLAKMLRLKVVVTNHGPDYDRQKWNRFAKAFLRTAERWGSKRADKVIAISKTITMSLQSKYNIHPAVIPNGVILHTFIDGKKIMREFGLTEHKYILAVGRLVPEKGFHDLIKAFRALPKDHNWKLVIAGCADHKDEYSRTLIAQSQGDKDIIMAGFVQGERLQALYQNRGLFVLPSYHEGLPIALLEALSYGGSCLVSDIPANVEIGLYEHQYFKTGDVSELSRKISLAMKNDADENDDIFQRDSILKKYSWDNIADQTLEVYRAVADIGSHPVRTSARMARELNDLLLKK